MRKWVFGVFGLDGTASDRLTIWQCYGGSYSFGDLRLGAMYSVSVSYADSVRENIYASVKILE